MSFAARSRARSSRSLETSLTAWVRASCIETSLDLSSALRRSISASLRIASSRSSLAALSAARSTAAFVATSLALSSSLRRSISMASFAASSVSLLVTCASTSAIADTFSRSASAS